MIVDAISAGMFHASMKEKVNAAEARKGELTARLANQEDSAKTVYLHPSLAQIYRHKVANLTTSCNDGLTGLERRKRCATWFQRFG